MLKIALIATVLLGNGVFGIRSVCSNGSCAIQAPVQAPVQKLAVRVSERRTPVRNGWHGIRSRSRIILRGCGG